MGYIHIMEKGGEELSEYRKALKMAKKGIDKICELSEDMEDEFGYGERRYSERYGNRGGYSRRDDEWEEMQERRYRDGRGRYM
ncbi:MAG: hypothetical protein IJ584_14825 [Bacteroidales bacterium]|nr:hypothetical protein [Bacteroidales bacterium]